MDIFQVIVLSLVESLTEFIPVSSTGHLILTQKFLNWDVPFAFDLIIQLGAFLAVVFYFFPLLKKIVVNLFLLIKKWLQKKNKELTSDEIFYSKLGIFILIASIPSGILGLIFSNSIEKYLQNEFFVALFLLLFSFVMFFADKKAKTSTKEIKQMDLKSMFKMGLWQILSILPGVSRSGSVMSGGLFEGFDRKTSAQLSFLIGLPIIFGGGIKGIYDILKGKVALDIPSLYIVIGLIVSFITGYFVIKYLIKFLEKNSLKPFIIYRVILALVIFAILLV